MTPIKNTLLVRFGVVYLVVLVIAIVIIGRLIDLKVFQKEKWEAVANVIKPMPITPDRGNIYSEDMKLFASSIPFYDLRIDVSSEIFEKEFFNERVDSLSLALSNLFKDKTKADYMRLLKEGRAANNRYLLIKKDIIFAELRIAKNFPLLRKEKIGKKVINSGMITDRIFKRVNPQERLAERTIGYVNAAEEVVGIEGSFNFELSGFEGLRLMRKISGNQWIPLNNENIIDPVPGNDVITTINSTIQDIADEALEKQLRINDAQHGCAVVMEVKTGEIKAIVNLTRHEDGTYKEDFNYAVAESREPGSTFKLASLMAAIEDGYTTITDTINTGNGVASFYGVRMKDSKHGGHGVISVKDVLAYSSNIGTAKLITKYYAKNPDKYISRLYSFGLNDVAGIDIKGEKPPLIKKPGDASWSAITLPWMSHGYELSLTPLQILTFYNAVANDGMLVKPRIVRALMFNEDTIKTFHTEVKKSAICSENTLKQAREMLEAVAEYGSASILKNPHYKAAGKTGTAQMANDKFGYNKETGGVKYTASFCGYFPADKPRYSCIVVIVNPSQKGYYAAAVAVPVFKTIADKLFAYSFRIDKENYFIPDSIKVMPNISKCRATDFIEICKILKWDSLINKATGDWIYKDANKINSFRVDKTIMPDVLGMGLRDALYLLEKQGLNVQYNGRGKVVSQSILPGTIISNKMNVIITLS